MAALITNRLLREHPLHAYAPKVRLDADLLEGRIDGRMRGAGGAKASIAAKLDKLVGGARQIGKRGLRARKKFVEFDRRQRAIVKVHYFNHAGGGGKGLRAHARYIAREGAHRGASPTDEHEKPGPEPTAPQGIEAPSTNGRPFYGPTWDSYDGKSIVDDWAKNDKRHFRLILSPENGEALGDLRTYTREVMGRVEAALGTSLEWVAVDHCDTDNVHAHIILRGVGGNGKPLIIPREFIKHGFRNLARDVATERLGLRTPEQAREALQREVRAHRFTRLDALLAQPIDGYGWLDHAKIRAPNNPDLQAALRARIQELKRLGLAKDGGSDGTWFARDWRQQLASMERHLDIRKTIVNSRAAETKQVQLERQERQRGLER